MKINLEKAKEILVAISDNLIGREMELCKLDSFVGDGDHGTTVSKAFKNIKKTVIETKSDNISDLFMASAEAVAEVMGGAIGPIFSSILFGMSYSTKGKMELDTTDIADMFMTALEKVQAVGGAQVGDKTLVDSLYPATLALKENSDLGLKEAMSIAAEKAYTGAQGTKNLVAKKGRAHFLGEDSLNYVDAGSMTMYYFVQTFADYI